MLLFGLRAVLSMKGADKGIWCWACKLLSKQRWVVVRGGIKWGEVVRPMVFASANCGQDPQWHYTQCGSAVLVMFTAWQCMVLIIGYCGLPNLCTLFSWCMQYDVALDCIVIYWYFLFIYNQILEDVLVQLIYMSQMIMQAMSIAYHMKPKSHSLLQKNLDYC